MKLYEIVLLFKILKSICSRLVKIKIEKNESLVIY